MSGEVRQAVAHSPFSARILMVENVPHHEVSAYLKAACAFVLPSRREGLPFVILEAAASKVPIIASDIPGVREVVTDGITGRLVPVDRPAALIQAITDHLQDEKQGAIFSSRLFELVSAEFTWAHAYEQYVSL
jgi:glycosyltransferase involved in cell wall biosynthesis